MEIRFLTIEEVQVIELQGVLTEIEGAAVRFKLGEKLNQGRTKVLFELSHCDLSSAAAVKHLQDILSYTVTRNVVFAASGLNASDWPKLILPGGLQTKNFLSQGEALAYLKKTALPENKNYLSQKAAEGESDDAIKNRELEELVAQYDIFQHSHEFNDDPYRLHFLAEQFQTQSVSPEEISHAEEQAQAKLSEVQDENIKLNGSCEELAAKLKMLMQFRKEPFTDKELGTKRETLTHEIDGAKKDILHLAESLKKAMASVAGELKKFEQDKADLAQGLKDLETKAQNAEASFKDEQARLEAQDKAEEADFAAKTRSP